jgi:hypothetical protein
MSLQASVTAPQQPPRLALPPIIAANCRTPDDVAGEVQQQLKQHPQALVSGVELDMYSALRKMVTDEDIKVQYQARAKMLVVKPQECALPKRQRLPGTVFVVSAGPEDQAAVDQVKVAAEHLGCYVIAKHQLNTQDLPKLMEQATGLQAADIVVVIAGVDTALPGVLCGLTDAPIIAVPVSTATTNPLQSLGSLLATVSSCPPGVSVVNVDGTVNAAVMCARMLRVVAARVEKLHAAAATATGGQVASELGNGNGPYNNIVPGFSPAQVPVQQAAI